jgi:hypothetical protein
MTNYYAFVATTTRVLGFISVKVMVDPRIDHLTDHSTRRNPNMRHNPTYDYVHDVILTHGTSS